MLWSACQHRSDTYHQRWVDCLNLHFKYDCASLQVVRLEGAHRNKRIHLRSLSAEKIRVDLSFIWYDECTHQQAEHHTD